MARVTFIPPIANISGRLTSDSKIVLRTRNGRTQAYIIEHPYQGPTAPQRQRTIDSFKEAVNQSKTILADPVQRDEWEKRFKEHQNYFRKHPRSPYKRYSTLRGYVIAKLTQQLNAEAREEEVTESQFSTTTTTLATQTPVTTSAAENTQVSTEELRALFGDIMGDS